MISLEQLADGSVSDRNFQKLMALVLDTGGRTVGIRWGLTSVTFTASATSAGTLVSHGLGRQPNGVFVSTADSNDYRATAFNNSATQINVIGHAPGAITGSVFVYWVVIG